MLPSNPALLTSKLHQPALPAALVRRRRLIQQLNQGLEAGRPVTLVSAPAGYGKSTLVAEWLQKAQRPMAWLWLEQADDEALRFFTYFTAALQQAGVPISAELRAALAAGQLPPREALAGALFSELEAAPAGCVCVLDDCQVLEDPYILGVLNSLLRPPYPLHLVIVTREDPALPLARLRAHNLLTELRAVDLRFASDEVEHFIRQGMGLALSEHDLLLLEERTEGWIAGLQLAALAMRASPSQGGRKDPSAFVASLSGSHRFILGYLTEEVLSAQPPEVQAFLLQTSMLSRLSGELCDAVTGQSGSADLLEKLLKANLFLIPLDDEERWYRYHHLFADLLLNQLRRLQPKRLPELHQRASEWYAAHNLPAEAIEHALAAGDYEVASRLIEKHGWTLLNQGNVRQLEGWMQALPDEWRGFSPRTSLDFAWLHLLRSNFGLIPPYLQQTEAALARLDPAAPETAGMQAERLALLSNLMQTQGNVAGSLETARQALGLVSPDNLRVVGLASLGLGAAYRQAGNFPAAAESLQASARASQGAGDPVTGMLAIAHLTLMSLQYGRLHFAAGIAEQALGSLERLGAAPPPSVGAVHGALGLIYYQWNQVELARQHLLQGIQLGSFSGHNASVIYSKTNLARLLLAKGDSTSASSLLQEAAELLNTGAPGWVRPELIARQVDLWLALGDSAAAEAALRQSGVEPETPVSHQTDALHLAWLRLLQQRRDPAALPLAERLAAAAEASQRDGTVLQVQVLGALCQAEQPQAAARWLERALRLAERENYVRIFLDEGAPMAVLLRRQPASSFVSGLLALFPAPQALSRNPEAPVETLTERELEVLRLLAEGLTYAEIANRLVISVNTVRYHIKGIYGKLGVDKVAAALERARNLGLL